MSRTEQPAVRAAPKRQIGLLVRAGALARDDTVAVPDDEKLSIARPHRDNLCISQRIDAAHRNLRGWGLRHDGVSGGNRLRQDRRHRVVPLAGPEAEGRLQQPLGDHFVMLVVAQDEAAALLA